MLDEFLMRVRIHSDKYRNWYATCTCGEELSAGDWRAVMEFALGHLSFAHPTS